MTSVKLNSAATFTTVIALTLLVGLPAPPAAAASTDPFQLFAAGGVGYEDNLFRLEDDSDILDTVGSTQLDDWYTYVGAGFESTLVAGEKSRYELEGQLFRRMYDRYDYLDHNYGNARAAGNWALTSTTDGTLAYAYRRYLRNFSNQVSPRKDVVDQHGPEAHITQALGERWQLGLGGSWRDFSFSTSELLDKQSVDAEVELRYAASQKSTFGVLTTFTDSNFDHDPTRDFSGWSAGPLVDWQITGSSNVEAFVAYTHQGLDSAAAGVDDYSGVTGYLLGRWSPGDRFSSELRVFRDISTLDGEVAEYTLRTGVEVQPNWQMTPKLSTNASLRYENRNFSISEATVIDRKDDYFRFLMGLAFAATSRLLISLDYAYEWRDSTIDAATFDAHSIAAGIRMSF